MFLAALKLPHLPRAPLGVILPDLERPEVMPSHWHGALWWMLAWPQRHPHHQAPRWYYPQMGRLGFGQQLHGGLGLAGRHVGWAGPESHFAGILGKGYVWPGPPWHRVDSSHKHLKGWSDGQSDRACLTGSACIALWLLAPSASSTPSRLRWPACGWGPVHLPKHPRRVAAKVAGTCHFPCIHDTPTFSPA